MTITLLCAMATVVSTQTGDAGIGEICGGRVARAALALPGRGLVDYHLDIDAAGMGGFESREDRNAREAVGLNQDLLLGAGDLLHHHSRAVLAWCEAHLPGGLLREGGRSQEQKAEEGEQSHGSQYAGENPVIATHT
jgi:hypothetical protein